MSTVPTTPVPPLLRPPSYQQTAVEWAPGRQPRFVVINPMHIISLQDKTKTFAVRAVEKIKAISEKWFTHVLLLLFLIIFASLGALLFQWLEQDKEHREKTSVELARNLTIQQLWSIVRNTTTEGEWWAVANRDLVAYEKQVEVLLKSKAVTDSETRVWGFWGALFYCGTVFTTIGYGNIYPATTAGQAATIVYAFFGIPFLLMVLADLGKLFTRWIKALFYYVRLFYHTGKFRKARRMGRRATAVPVQYMSVALNKMPYVMSPSRSRKRGSTDDSKQRDLESANSSNKMSDDEKENRDATEEGSDVLSQNHVDSDSVVAEKGKKKSKKDKKTEEEEEAASAIPAVSPDEIDDEFNLPVSLAVIVLVTYMTVGAAIFTIWEDWTFFESFYFVFISMSTIGFGDYVPDHPMFMMATFIYLLFGLALTSMCINIVQEKLSATFEMAKLRIGTTIGLDANMFMTEEVMSDRSDSPESQKTKGSLKSRRGSKVPPGKTPERDTQSEEEDKRGKSDGSGTEGSPQQVKNGSIKKRPDTLSVEPTQYE